jgi:beta-N-acetylhexosaminidase
LYPFIKGIEQNVDSIMIGHLAVPSLNNGQNTSATLSKSIIQNLLREQLGYDGLVISDALNMRSVSDLYSKRGQLEWEAFNAGNDVLCFAENVPEGIQEILKNASPERIEESFQRIWKCKQKAGILDKNSPVGNLDFETASILNKKIAQNCLTKIKDNHNTKAVFEAENRNSLAKISIYKGTDNVFFQTLKTKLSSPEFVITLSDENTIVALEKNLKKFDTLLIALFVPKAKPLNNFDMGSNVLAFLGQLFKTKKCILYVFGNPYALQVIPNLNFASGIVQVYQDFAEFQESAAEQLLQNLECKGSLPVEINGL